MAPFQNPVAKRKRCHPSRRGLGKIFTREKQRIKCKKPGAHCHVRPDFLYPVSFASTANDLQFIPQGVDEHRPVPVVLPPNDIAMDGYKGEINMKIFALR